ncbi:hypothetical protein BJX99DRAFT_259660 [Aspergillus californicus]
MSQLTALDPLNKPAQVKWNSYPEMRIVLCCMMKYYETDHHAFQEIFNTVFAEELRACGFKQGQVKWSRLDIQWKTMRHQGDTMWGEVHLSAFEHELWLQFTRRIEDAATSLGLTIVKKTEDNIDSSRFRYRNPDNRYQYSPASGQNEPSGTNQLHEGQLSQTESVKEDVHNDLPTDFAIRLDSQAQNPSIDSKSPLCIAGGKEAVNSKHGPGTPPLLYRWWNTTTHGVNSETKFVAGLFADAYSQYFPPDTVSQNEFQQRFLTHIQRDKSPTPFISTFQSLLAPVHRSLRGQEGATVSIIDSKKLNTKVFSAKAFVRQHKVRIPHSNYSGAGEHLVWGQIDHSSIVCSFKITKLLEIAAENPDIESFLQLPKIAAFEKARTPLHRAMSKDAIPLDKRAGAIVGKLLCMLEVPEVYCKIISEGMTYSWRIKTKAMPWGEFFEGVNFGFDGQHFMPSPALSPAARRVNHIESEPGWDFVEESDDDSYELDSEDNMPETMDQSGINDVQTELETASNRSSAIAAVPVTPYRTFRALTNFGMVATQSPISITDSSDEEISEDEGLDLSYELQHTRRDLFASDRARMLSEFDEF